MNCYSCSAKISKRSAFCPECGEYVFDPSKYGEELFKFKTVEKSMFLRDQLNEYIISNAPYLDFDELVSEYLKVTNGGYNNGFTLYGFLLFLKRY